MALREQLLTEYNKKSCLRIVQWIDDSEERFAELVHLFLHDEYRVVQRAAWPMSYVVRAHPSFIKKHLPAILGRLKQPDQPPAVKRNIVRLLQFIDIPKKYCGLVMSHCFNYICDPVEKAAVKAFSLTVLENLSASYPDIRAELKTVIENNIGNETPAFVSRAKKILKRL